MHSGPREKHRQLGRAHLFPSKRDRTFRALGPVRMRRTNPLPAPFTRFTSASSPLTSHPIFPSGRRWWCEVEDGDHVTKGGGATHAQCTRRTKVSPTTDDGFSKAILSEAIRPVFYCSYVEHRAAILVCVGCSHLVLKTV